MNSKIPDVYFVFSYSFVHIFGHSTKFEFQMRSPCVFFFVMLSHRLQCVRILRYHILTFDYTLPMNIEQFKCANTFEFFVVIDWDIYCRFFQLQRKTFVQTGNVNISHTYVFLFIRTKNVSAKNRKSYQYLPLAFNMIDCIQIHILLEKSPYFFPFKMN